MEKNKKRSTSIHLHKISPNEPKITRTDTLNLTEKRVGKVFVLIGKLKHFQKISLEYRP